MAVVPDWRGAICRLGSPKDRAVCIVPGPMHKSKAVDNGKAAAVWTSVDKVPGPIVFILQMPKNCEKAIRNVSM
jgi:hypothetical protein